MVLIYENTFILTSTSCYRETNKSAVLSERRTLVSNIDKKFVSNIRAYSTQIVLMWIVVEHDCNTSI